MIVGYQNCHRQRHLEAPTNNNRGRSATSGMAHAQYLYPRRAFLW